jgi:hypothetical protein
MSPDLRGLLGDIALAALFLVGGSLLIAAMVGAVTL